MQHSVLVILIPWKHLPLFESSVEVVCRDVGSERLSWRQWRRSVWGSWRVKLRAQSAKRRAMPVSLSQGDLGELRAHYHCLRLWVLAWQVLSLLTWPQGHCFTLQVTGSLLQIFSSLTHSLFLSLSLYPFSLSLLHLICLRNFQPLKWIKYYLPCLYSMRQLFQIFEHFSCSPICIKLKCSVHSLPLTWLYTRDFSRTFSSLQYRLI